MRNQIWIAFLITISICSLSCTCTNVDCPEDGIDVSISFVQNGSTQVISIEGYNISVTASNNSNVPFVFVKSGFPLDDRGISFFARNNEKYRITLNDDISTSVEIGTIVSSEDDCCENYAIQTVKIEDVDVNCNEECLELGFLTIAI